MTSRLTEVSTPGGGGGLMADFWASLPKRHSDATYPRRSVSHIFALAQSQFIPVHWRTASKS